MTTKEFWKLCSNHDWYYPYSDDQRYWSAGVRKEAVLAAAMKEQPELVPHYKEWIKWLEDADVSKKSPAEPA